MTPLEKSTQTAKDVAMIARNAIDKIIELEKAVQEAYERGFIDGMQEQLRRIVEKQVSKFSDQYSDIVSDGGLDPREKKDA